MVLVHVLFLFIGVVFFPFCLFTVCMGVRHDFSALIAFESRWRGRGASAWRNVSLRSRLMYLHVASVTNVTVGGAVFPVFIFSLFYFILSSVQVVVSLYFFRLFSSVSLSLSPLRVGVQLLLCLSVFFSVFFFLLSLPSRVVRFSRAGLIAVRNNERGGARSPSSAGRAHSLSCFLSLPSPSAAKERRKRKRGGETDREKKINPKRPLRMYDIHEGIASFGYILPDPLPFPSPLPPLILAPPGPFIHASSPPLYLSPLPLHPPSSLLPSFLP